MNVCVIAAGFLSLLAFLYADQALLFLHFCADLELIGFECTYTEWDSLINARKIYFNVELTLHRLWIANYSVYAHLISNFRRSNIQSNNKPDATGYANPSAVIIARLLTFTQKKSILTHQIGSCDYAVPSCANNTLSGNCWLSNDFYLMQTFRMHLPATMIGIPAFSIDNTTGRYRLRPATFQ